MNCVECGDKGFILRHVIYDVNGERTFVRVGVPFEEEVWIPCGCRKIDDAQRILDRKYNAASIPKKYRKFTLESYRQLSIPPKEKEANKVHIEYIESFLKTPEIFLEKINTFWLWGVDDNSGHTAFAIIMGKALIEFGYRVKFIKMEHLLNAFTDFDNKDYINNLKNYQVIIIDDAFDIYAISDAKQYTRVHLYHFLDDMISDEKNFIMTSDKPIPLIKETFKEYSKVASLLERSYKELNIRGRIGI